MDKITLEELSAKMADPDTDPQDLAAYFTEDTERSAPFQPAIALNPDRVEIPDTDDAASRSALLLNGANWIERQNRRSKFFRRLSDGYDGPIIVEEGDSWFQFPILLHDTIDVLMEDFAVMSLSAGGDTLANMVRRAEYRKAIEQTGATILLLSGGGNDLVADGQLARHLRRFDSALGPADYLLPSFDQLVATAVAQFDRIFRDVAVRYPKVRILCHGYDFAIPANGKWLGKPMIAQGIADSAMQAGIAKVMMDRFNIAMAALAQRHGHVRFLDLRGTVGNGRWHDELHPTDPGYRDVARQFAAAIRSISGGQHRGRARGSDGPSSVSLHVGLNTVDRSHYGNGLVQLDFCVADAEAMEAVAADRGFADRTVLKDDAGTRDAIIDACADAAKRLKAGDIFMFTYAGHGGQIKDFNHDEATGPDGDTLDETLCLYDAQLIDDELYKDLVGLRRGRARAGGVRLLSLRLDAARGRRCDRRRHCATGQGADDAAGRRRAGVPRERRVLSRPAVIGIGARAFDALPRVVLPCAGQCSATLGLPVEPEGDGGLRQRAVHRVHAWHVGGGW